MTVSYTANVANCDGLGCFWKLLFRWKGSIYKLLWPNLVVYVLLYYILYFVYMFALDEESKRIFEVVCKYCLEYSDLIPLSFVLGFYVNLVVKRWWEMFQSIPGTDTLAIFVSNSIHGQDDRCRLMRRTIMRYVNLSYIMILTMVSTRVKKRFPTLDHLVEAGVMLPGEKKIFDDLNARSRYSKYWMPLVWAGSIIARARKEGRIRDDFAVKTLLDELCNFRSKCGALNGYDWVPVPLVYTQVVTLAVYSFFIATLMGRQLVGEQQNLYVPVFAFLQFFFYMGWLKVAESLVNPFGEDDDDFETSWLVDRNLQVSYLIVDEMHNEHPELIRDQYWDDVVPQELPHTIASQAFRSSPYLGSTAQLDLTPLETEVLPSSSQLHRLDEESEDELTEDDFIIDNDGGESGLPPKSKSPRKKVKRQVSVSSEAPNSYQSSQHLRVSRKPSVTSVFQSALNRFSGMGSNMSLTSGVGRRRGFGRSTSRYSSGGPSRPPTPPQDDIFKMSDLSIDVENATPVNTPMLKPSTSKANSQDLQPLNIKSASERRKNFSKSTTSEINTPTANTINSDVEEEEEPLIATTPSPIIVIAGSQPQNSPLNRQKQFFPPKSSPKLLPKTAPSPQNSPRNPRAPLLSFYMSSDGSQTDRGAPSKVTHVPLAEEEEDVPDEEREEEETPPPVALPLVKPIAVPARVHRDSGRDQLKELEPIEEQSERQDSASPEGS